MNNEEKKIERISFALGGDLLKAIREKAKQERRSVSDYIRLLIEDAIKK